MPMVLSAVLAGPGVASGSPAPPSGLHSCGTSVDGNVANGWCEGTGTFRVIAACEDGRFARSPWTTIRGGNGTLGVSCWSKAVGAEIEEA